MILLSIIMIVIASAWDIDYTHDIHYGLQQLAHMNTLCVIILCVLAF